MQSESHPAWLEIDLSVVEQNVRAIRQLSGVDVMAVVKADAYGYGATQVAAAALRGGATWLGVARVDEGLALRSAGFEQPILVLGMVPLGQIDSAIGAGLRLPVASNEGAAAFSARAQALGRSLAVHLKLDTGMGRLGVLPADAAALGQFICAQPGLLLEGVFSHLANADRQDDPSVSLQLSRFRQALAGLYGAGIRPQLVHLANTAAALAYPETCFNLVRVGQGLMGHNAFSDRPLHPAIRRALQAWKARLVSCRRLPAGSRVGDESGYITTCEEVIGIVSAGYGDGIWRQPGNEVLIGGRRQAAIGLPHMDCMLVRLSRPYPLDSEVLLTGTQGTETITIQDLALRYGTGPGKITAVIPRRVKRVYLSGAGDEIG